MHHALGRTTFCFMLLAMFAAAEASEPAEESTDKFQWFPGRLIPNEFGLKDGTWSGRTVLECIELCEADASCSGFSVEKVIGDAWAAGCKAQSCAIKTECHAKGVRADDSFWLPSDGDIRVPAVDAHSNAWIEGWGTILKQQKQD